MFLDAMLAKVSGAKPLCMQAQKATAAAKQQQQYHIPGNQSGPQCHLTNVQLLPYLL
jgi:hypothetical protein